MEATECDVVEFDMTVRFKMVAAELETMLSLTWNRDLERCGLMWQLYALFDECFI